MIAEITGGRTSPPSPETCEGLEEAENFDTKILECNHVHDLRRSGLTDTTIEALVFSTVAPREIRKDGVVSAYRIPYWDLDGKIIQFERWRLFPAAKNVGGHTQKYHQVKGSDCHGYFPPLLKWRDIASASDVTVVITEGEKKAAAGCQSGLYALGIGGVWNWRTKTEDGERLVLPELDQFVWRGRIVEIVPDSDAWLENKIQHVLGGFYALGMELLQRGAHVQLVQLYGSEGTKAGLDDWLLGQDEKWREAWNQLVRLELSDHRLKPLAAWWQNWSRKQLACGESAQPVIPLEAVIPLSLPNGVFPLSIDAMVEAVAAHTETPRELAAMMGLAALGACCQKTFDVEPEPGYVEPLNIWTVVALEPGNRKTAVMRAMTYPLIEWEREIAEAAGTDILRLKSERETREAQIKELRVKAAKKGSEDIEEFESLKAKIVQLEATLPEIPKVPRLWTQDITPEKLGQVMAENGERIAILSDEGGIFDIMGGRYNNGIPNLDIFLQAHAGASVRVDRGSRPPVVMQHPALTIGLSPQPEVLRGLTHNPSFRGRGLLGRFLYSLPPSPLGFRHLNTCPIPPSVATTYRKVLYALLAVKPERDERGNTRPYTLRFSGPAYHEWKEFARTVERDMRDGARFEAIKDWAGKLPGAAARIAGLFHCAEHAHGQPWVIEISLIGMTHALTLAEALSAHALAVFDLMGADPGLDGARKVWRWVERHRHRTFTARMCHQDLRGIFKRAESLAPAFQVLLERGYLVEEVPTQRPGRPSRGFTVNPVLMEGWS